LTSPSTPAAHPTEKKQSSRAAIMADLQQLKAPRVELDQQQPLQTWNRDVYYSNFRMVNPENCVQGIVHRSEEVLFDDMPMHLGMKYAGEDVGFYVYPVILVFI
jgi:hypothetical protein